MWVPYSSRGAAVSEAYTVTQWPIMVAACMTVHRVQGVGFERVVLWILLERFLRAGARTNHCIQGAEPTGLFLVLPDTAVVGEREEAKDVLKDVFQTTRAVSYTHLTLPTKA